MLKVNPLLRVRPFGDLHFYQKWHIVWRQLSRLPRTQPLHVLDVGCGDGRWSLEVALRRPAWTVLGIDRDATEIARGEARRRQLGVTNASFKVSDFATFVPDRRFHVLLGVCSTHYGPTALDTDTLFDGLGSWLLPGARMLLLLPRRREETPFVERLAHPVWHDVFGAARLNDLCASAGCIVDQLIPCVGRVGTMAKQLDWSREHVNQPASSALRLVAQGLVSLDARMPAPRHRSLMWLLIARRRG